MAGRVAVVLFNLGGPDGPDDVRPFLFNLFNDKAIIGAPQPIRYLLARLISTTREKSARENYARMGGGSPLLPETSRQAEALERELRARGVDASCIVAMRYWNPTVEKAVQTVKAVGAVETILLPLYPQFSTTTTGSSMTAWRKAGGDPVARLVCCYPETEGLVRAHADALISTWREAGEPPNVRVLLSAHGLPEKVIADGDPYQWQVERTSAAIRALLPPEWEVETCYQSRVGPLKWIGPPTDECIVKAAREGKTILLSPVAFVSEHIETLVELDIEYRHLAEKEGCRTYLRAPAPGVTPGFISMLADLVQESLADPATVRGPCGQRICPAGRSACPHRAGKEAAA